MELEHCGTRIAHTLSHARWTRAGKVTRTTMTFLTLLSLFVVWWMVVWLRTPKLLPGTVTLRNITIGPNESLVELLYSGVSTDPMVYHRFEIVSVTVDGAACNVVGDDLRKPGDIPNMKVACAFVRARKGIDSTSHIFRLKLDKASTTEIVVAGNFVVNNKPDTKTVVISNQNGTWKCSVR